MVLDLKKLSRDEANKAIESLRESRIGPLCRLNHYQKLIGADELKTAAEVFNLVECSITEPTGNLRMTESEHMETTLSDIAAGLRSGAKALAGISELTRVVPTPEIHTEPLGCGLSLKAGPKQVSKAFRAASLEMEVTAQVTQHLSDSAAKINMFTRQYQDRVLQANSAGHELNAINAQIKIEEIRVSIVEQDIELQEQRIEVAKATEEFLRSKYTNKELYSWQETQLRTLHYQTYIVAYDLAKKVEQSYHFERGIAGTDANFITPGWDDGRDGLLSAETLGLGLRRLEAAYQESRGHDFEITKHISLRQINPKALLQLRGPESKCTFSLSDTLFNTDFPGHHTRRLKSVSLSLPCVVEPYTAVNCTLQLTSNSYRLGEAAQPTVMESNYVPIQSVAFSNGQNDPGVFELNFHDDRYLPFEGAGVISTWDLSLPEFRAFDYDTISDVVMQLRYTSIAGSSTRAAEFLKKRGGKGDELYASFDLLEEFASQRQGLGSGRTVTISNLNTRQPWWTTKYSVGVVKIEFLSSNTAEFEFQIGETEGGEDVFLKGVTAPNREMKESGTWYFTLNNPPPILPTDLWMVVQYTADKIA